MAGLPSLQSPGEAEVSDRAVTHYPACDARLVPASSGRVINDIVLATKGNKAATV